MTRHSLHSHRVPVEPRDLPEGAGERYARHYALPGFGLEGQRRLYGARVLSIGAGGLGAPVIQYLAAAGVGTLGVIDFDVVEITNLQRQVIHSGETRGQKKTTSAREFVDKLNPLVSVETYPFPLTEDNVDGLIAGYDIVVDGCDNFDTRYTVADACVRADIPLVWGSINRYSGQLSVFDGGITLRDIFPEPPAPGTVQNCAEGGVLGVLPGVVGTMMANETIKLITGIGTPLYGKLAVWDGKNATLQHLNISPRPETRARVFDRQASTAGDGRGEPGITTCATTACSAEKKEDEGNTMVHERDILEYQDLTSKGALLVDVREPVEWAGGQLPKALEAPLSVLRRGEIDSLPALADLPRDTPLAVYCAGGVRSKEAIGILQQAGFTNLVNLAGGINRWWAYAR